MTEEALMKLLGLIYSMEVCKLPERRMYWSTEDQGIFPAMKYGSIMSRYRFEEINKYLQFGYLESADKQVLSFINAVNENFNTAITYSIREITSL